jgi:hypothetical protein
MPHRKTSAAFPNLNTMILPKKVFKSKDICEVFVFWFTLLKLKFDSPYFSLSTRKRII